MPWLGAFGGGVGGSGGGGPFTGTTQWELPGAHWLVGMPSTNPGTACRPTLGAGGLPSKGSEPFSTGEGLRASSSWRPALAAGLVGWERCTTSSCSPTCLSRAWLDTAGWGWLGWGRQREGLEPGVNTKLEALSGKRSVIAGDGARFTEIRDHKDQGGSR